MEETRGEERKREGLLNTWMNEYMKYKITTEIIT